MDLERYLPAVEDQFVTEEAALAFLRTLFEIMSAFVDLGWGVDSIHLAIPELAKISSADSEVALGSLDQHIENEFKAASQRPPEREIP
ncbi:MAG: hypothetical protein C0456_06345 [Hyphomonas sp.]|nr:hypothetical protein [Hyphomonas sp.]